jgi:hypothetical protein
MCGLMHRTNPRAAEPVTIRTRDLEEALKIGRLRRGTVATGHPADVSQRYVGDRDAKPHGERLVANVLYLIDGLRFGNGAAGRQTRRSSVLVVLVCDCACAIARCTS